MTNIYDSGLGHHYWLTFGDVWIKSLHWRHNDHGGISNHQPHGCLLNRLFRRRSKKTSKLRVTGLCAGNSPGPVNSPHKGLATQKMVLFDDIIMYKTIISRKSIWKRVCKIYRPLCSSLNVLVDKTLLIWNLAVTLAAILSIHLLRFIVIGYFKRWSYGFETAKLCDKSTGT